MRKSTKGSYTLEAVIFLPLVILAVLSLGYFIRVEGIWENCMHGALDESSSIGAKAFTPAETAETGIKVKERIEKDNPGLDRLRVSDVRIMYSDGHADSLVSFKIEAAESVSFPLGFSRDFGFEGRIKFRGFVGTDTDGMPMGPEGLECDEIEDPVWIFPHMGEKYHQEQCTYVKASASPCILTGSIKKRYKSCGICNSEDMALGEIVFCFSSGDAYHRGSCRSIDRRVTVIDRSEAIEKGYSACSKCGGGGKNVE